jgi:phosphatidylserine decarboxylase
LLLKILSILPRKAVSHLTGIIVHLESPQWFARFLKYKLIDKLNIATCEAEHPVDHYKSFGAFFARRLKGGARPMGEDSIVSPCDGVISEKGHISNGHLTQCKDIDYSVSKLLKNDAFSEQFIDGAFMTIYLAPFNYHRVHVPADATIVENYTIAGDLWPVNKISVTSIDELFCINERNISICSTDKGNYAQIMVGATNVGSIELMPEIKKGNKVSKGDEYGIFNMGSTVVLLFDRNLKESLTIETIETNSIACLSSFNRK